MDNEKSRSRRESRKRKSRFRILMVLFCLLIAGAALLYLFSAGLFRKDETKSVDTSRLPEITEERAQVKVPETTPGKERETLVKKQPAPAVVDAGAQQPESKAATCGQLENNLHGFFSHLDGQDYIQEFGLKEKSEPYFLNLAEKLLDNPPIVSRETDNLLSILKNMAHIFRTIGKNNIVIIKTILDREREDIEDVAKAFYLLSIRPRCPDNQVTTGGDPNNYYDYAGFFLTTIGGRAYLFRRDSRLRLLVNYYAVLIIDDANKKLMNRYGIDLQQIIPALIGEMESSNKLIYKERYLDRLYLLLEKYQ